MTGPDLNEQPRPRVLVDIDDDVLRDAVLQALEGLAGTARHFSDRSFINQKEWDAVISTRPPSDFHNHPFGREYTRSYEAHLQVFTLLNPVRRFADYAVDEEGSVVYGVETVHVIGTSAHIDPGLDDEISALARTQLLPMTRRRDEQPGVQVVNPGIPTTAPSTTAGFSPIMTGPAPLVYAATYHRTPTTTAWAVPHDVADLHPWFVAAFRSWHKQDPAVFPSAPDWFEDRAWYSVEESALAEKIEQEKQLFTAAQQAHDAKVRRLEEELMGLRALSASGERQLLIGQGDPLQAEVLRALLELGFEVEDMDEVWDARERREDYRIRDSDDPAWLVIADATGTTKGVKGAKLMAVQRFVTKWVAENPGHPIPGYWVIANHFAEQDPASRRPDLIRSDELSAAIQEDGVVVDTVALYHLLRAVRQNPELRQGAREQLRHASGQYTSTDAIAWITAQSSARID